MENVCANCKFYTPISHRGQRYPKGFCGKHVAYRLSDKYQMHLTISTPYEYTCDLHELAPQPMYAISGGEVYLIPPIVADALIKNGWVRVHPNNETDKTFIEQDKSGDQNGQQ